MTAAKDGGAGFFDDEPIAYATNTAIITTTKEESDSVHYGKVLLDTMDNNPRLDCHGSAEESIYDDDYEMLGEVALWWRVYRDGNVERQEEVPTVYLDYSSRLVSSLGTSKTMKH